MIPVHLARAGLEPSAELARLRIEEPITRTTLPNGLKVWVVTSHRLVREVLSDSERFGNDRRIHPDPNNPQLVRPLGAAALGRTGDITAYDPPEHGRLRGLLGAEFTAKRVQALRPQIERIVAGALDEMERTGSPVDLVRSFAVPVPSLIIFELLGVPYEDRAVFQETAARRFDTTLSMGIRDAAVEQSRSFLRGFVARQRIEPGDGLLGRMIRQHGDEMDDRELAGIGDIVLFAGHETTANMLALGTIVLLRQPEYLEQLLDEQVVPRVVEELLRFVSVVQATFPRVCLTDTVIGGTKLRRGEQIMCSLPAGNLDDAFTPGADRFDPLRAARAHLAFGHGIHYCLGAMLARLELAIAFPALARRFPRLRLAVPEESLQFYPAAGVYGVRALPVAW